MQIERRIIIQCIIIFGLLGHNVALADDSCGESLSTITDNAIYPQQMLFEQDLPGAVAPGDCVTITLKKNCSSYNWSIEENDGDSDVEWYFNGSTNTETVTVCLESTACGGAKITVAGCGNPIDYFLKSTAGTWDLCEAVSDGSTCGNDISSQPAYQLNPVHDVYIECRYKRYPDIDPNPITATCSNGFSFTFTYPQCDDPSLDWRNYGTACPSEVALWMWACY